MTTKWNKIKSTRDFYTSLRLTRLLQSTRKSEFVLSQGLNSLIKQITISMTNYQ
jgi:hypothetical protein